MSKIVVPSTTRVCHALVALDLVLGPLLDALPLCGHNPVQARRRALCPFPPVPGLPPRSVPARAGTIIRPLPAGMAPTGSSNAATRFSGSSSAVSADAGATSAITATATS